MADAESLGGRVLPASARTQERKARELDTVSAFPDEIAHLSEIKGKLKDAVQKAVGSVERYDKEYMDTKLYMVEHRGDIDPREMFQNELIDSLNH